MKAKLTLLTLTALLAFATMVTQVPAVADCGGEKSQCGSDSSCGAKDYLAVTEQELSLLGRTTFHSNVSKVEEALNTRGTTLPGKGMVTSDLRNALIAFQESKNLPATGEITPDTLAALGISLEAK